MRTGRSSRFSSFLKSFMKNGDSKAYFHANTKANKIKCNYDTRSAKTQYSVTARGSGPTVVSAHQFQEFWYFIQTPYSAQSASSLGVGGDA